MQIPVNSSIILREIELSDAIDIFKTIDSQRLYFRKWLPFVDFTKEITDTQEFIISTKEAQEKGRELTFVILFQERFVGLIGFKDIDKSNKKTEIGYWLSENYQKRGIITQSVQRLIHLAFEDMEMNRIQIKCANGNIPSKNIPKRLGFILEGIEREGELLCDGHFTNLEVYSLLCKDFYKV